MYLKLSIGKRNQTAQHTVRTFSFFAKKKYLMFLLHHHALIQDLISRKCVCKKCIASTSYIRNCSKINRHCLIFEPDIRTIVN